MSATVLFDYPNPLALANYLAGQFDETTEPDRDSAAPRSLADAVESSTDDELFDIIGKEFGVS
jgi:hypothetical protein